MIETVRSRPCLACPYRKDVPSGVWSAEDYDKLPLYDVDTLDQPTAAFACHATPEHLCNGWVVVHTSRPHEFDLLALRVREVDHIPEPSVPMFASGAEAAEHGKRDIEDPSPEAIAVVARLMDKYARLRDD